MITIAADLPAPGFRSPGAPGPHSSISKPTLTRFLNRACAAIGLPGTVSVLLTSDRELKRLNQTFRHKNKPTDVLSFPADPIPGLPEAHRHAGDLAISLDTAARQAHEHGHTLDAELRILLLHGLLHLAGLDHETDHGQMGTRESALRTELRLPNTLIARTHTSPSARVKPLIPARTPNRPPKPVIPAGAQRSGKTRFSTRPPKPTEAAPPARTSNKLRTENRQQTTSTRGLQ